MLNAKQIETLICNELRPNVTKNDWDHLTPRIHLAAEKIAASIENPYQLVAAAAKADTETMETLMHLLAGTILVTLAEEEGFGRCNITYSPMSMDYMTKHYDLTAERSGMETIVRVAPKENSSMERQATYRKPAGVMRDNDESADDAKPQADPKPERPIWVIVNFPRDGGDFVFLRMHDRADAERQMKAGNYSLAAHIENRFCMHHDCPSTGCNHAEVTSNS